MTEEPHPTAAIAFALLWENLADLIGTSATATLVRKAAKHAATQAPALSGLTITKPAFDYEFVVPAHWSDDGSHELKALVRSLLPLLVELTGSIVVQRLRSIPALAVMLVQEDVHES